MFRTEIQLQRFAMWHRLQAQTHTRYTHTPRGTYNVWKSLFFDLTSVFSERHTPYLFKNIIKKKRKNPDYKNQIKCHISNKIFIRYLSIYRIMSNGNGKPFSSNVCNVLKLVDLVLFNGMRSTYFGTDISVSDVFWSFFVVISALISNIYLIFVN